LKVEDDLKKIHDRHVKLMREMDENYQLVEQQSNGYYAEFMGRWREAVKEKVRMYKVEIEGLVREKDDAKRERERMSEKVRELAREKERVVREYGGEIRRREEEIEDIQRRWEEDRIEWAKERDKMKQTYEEQLRELKHERDAE
jgi:hypothetical protein